MISSKLNKAGGMLSLRHVVTKPFLSHRHTRAVSGLAVLSSLGEGTTNSGSLLHHCLNLHEKINHIKQAGQASVFKSNAHNLTEDRYYRLIYFEEEQGHYVNAQSFDDYGDKGHSLTYFIGNKNIPRFIKKALITPLESTNIVHTIKKRSATNELNWRLTFNTYQSREGSDGTMMQAGFGWHKDLPVNGEVTTITTVLGESLFEIRKIADSTTPAVRPISKSYPLSAGSTIILSGDSRWDHEHRVVPQSAKGLETGSLVDGITRISIVLGCQPL